MSGLILFVFSRCECDTVVTIVNTSNLVVWYFFADQLIKTNYLVMHMSYCFMSAVNFNQ